MAKQIKQITNILAGWSPTQYFGQEGSYNSSLGIDPDLPIASENRTSGAIVPVAYADFSDTDYTAVAKWLVNTPKDTLTYAYLNDGALLTYSSTLTAVSEADLGTIPTSDGNGLAYYNNFDGMLRLARMSWLQ